MIKKCAILLITLLYLGTTTGVAFNLNYCCGKLVSLKVDQPVKKCAMPAMASPGCCKSTHINIKVKDAHEASGQLHVSKVFSFKLPFGAFSGLAGFSNPLSQTGGFDPAPPRPPSLNRIAFLKNRVFRI